MIPNAAPVSTTLAAVRTAEVIELLSNAVVSPFSHEAIQLLNPGCVQTSTGARHGLWLTVGGAHPLVNALYAGSCG
jgi:hypothetical protein